MANTFDPVTLRLFVAVCEERNIARILREGSAEIGVMWDLTDTTGLATVPYRRDRLCLATPLGHPLAKRKRIAFADAVSHVTVAVAPGGLMDRLLNREAARLGTSLVNRIQVSGLDAAARIVAAGLGTAILPREAVEMYVAGQHLTMVPLTDAWAQRQFVICHRADGGVSATTRLLVEALRVAAVGERR